MESNMINNLVPAKSFSSQGSGPKRNRKHSWSRPQRKMSLMSEEEKLWPTECKIEGQATIAFSPDGSWFQGNVNSPSEDSYTISGERTSIINQKLSAVSTNNDISKSTAYNESKLASLTIENQDVGEDTLESYFDVTIMDYETGINHNIQGTICQIHGNQCKLSADKLNFKATSCCKGMRADMVLSQLMGPKLNGKNLIVYQGNFTFTYSDLACYPTSWNSSNWCL